MKRSIQRFPAAGLVWVFVMALFSFSAIDATAQEREATYTVGEINKISSKAVDTGTATALGLNLSDVITLEFSGSPGSSDPNSYDVFSAAASSFPTEGGEYLVMTTGDSDVALTPDDEGDTGGDNNGADFGGEGFDLAIMTLELTVPSGASQFQFDFKFFSEEFPEFVGSEFNDGFFGDLGPFSITFDGNTPESPANIIFDQNGDPVTINTTGALGMNAANASGTTYDGATPVVTTSLDLSSEGFQPGDTFTLTFSLFDVGDSVYDSAVFLDNFRFATGAGGGSCTATTLEESVANPSDGPGVVTSTFSNPEGILKVAFVDPSGNSALNNFTAANPSGNYTTLDGGITWEAVSQSSPPTTAEFELTQTSEDQPSSYFAEASSVCPDPDPLVVDFDPIHFRHRSARPKAVQLKGNYPNPFGAQTTIEYTLPGQSDVRVSVYDVMGRQVATLVDGTQPSGLHTVNWDGRSDGGQRLASGVYLLRLKAANQTLTRRISVVR